MAVIKVDGREYEVEAGRNLLETCLELGLDLPYFCWHPAMGSVGACRQCAVVQFQDEEDTRGRIVMGCMTPVSDGAIFSLGGDRASAFREAVVESLMLNHPHDCPVCAEGGECHLQDMTVMVGHRDRHYRGRKNTHRNQYLGPLIHHEMNRCITCYRCTRYYADYAGGRDLAALAAHDHIYFGRHQPGVLESPFAGNLVEVCPTGVFTDKALVHEYTRKWDLQSAPSVCVGCAVGCNTLPGERYGKLKRIHNRYNREVNGYFLCDRGRFGGNFVNAAERLDYPGLRDETGKFRAVHADNALSGAIDACRAGGVAAIGSPRASLEANYALAQLVGTGNFCSGMDDEEFSLVCRATAQLCNSPAHNPSLREMESADAVLILGEDLTHTAPRTALSLRQAVRNRAFEMAADLQLLPWQDAAIRNLAQDQRSPLHIVAGAETALADVAASNSCLPAADQVGLARQVLATLRGEPAHSEAAAAIARDLQAAQRPLVISGTATSSAALLDAAADIAAALAREERRPMLSYCLPECNSMGVGLLAAQSSCSFAELAERAGRGELNTLLVLENDLFRRAPATLVQALRHHVSCIIGLDNFESATLALCDIVLPTAAFSESEGTLVSSEGRAQRLFPVHPPAVERRESWRWLLDMAQGLASESLAGISHFDQLCQACAAGCPALAGISGAAPEQDFRSRGLKIPRQTHRYSGRTAMRADVSVHEPRQQQDSESALAYTMEGASRTDRPGALLSYVWSPGWNSNQSLHKFQSEVGGELRGGTAGVRLLDTLQLESPASAPLPGAFERHQQDYQLQACYRIFGSDELSALTPAIAELAGDPFIELCSQDAQRLGVSAGDGVQLCQLSLELRINDSLPAGCAGFSAGYPACAELRSGQWAPLSRDPEWQHRHPQLIGSDGGSHHV